MIDYIILTAYSPFAVIMQLHPGWVGFLQTKVLNCLGCLWFNRTEVRSRHHHSSVAPAGTGQKNKTTCVGQQMRLLWSHSSLHLCVLGSKKHEDVHKTACPSPWALVCSLAACLLRRLAQGFPGCSCCSI